MQCHKPSGTRSAYGTGIFSRSSFHISWMAFILMNGALVVHQHLTQMSRMFFICNFEHHFKRRPFNVAWLACQPDRSNKRRYCDFYVLPFFFSHYSMWTYARRWHDRFMYTAWMYDSALASAYIIYISAHFTLPCRCCCGTMNILVHIYCIRPWAAAQNHTRARVSKHIALNGGIFCVLFRFAEGNDENGNIQVWRIFVRRTFDDYRRRATKSPWINENTQISQNHLKNAQIENCTKIQSAIVHCVIQLSDFFSLCIIGWPNEAMRHVQSRKIFQ